MSALEHGDAELGLSRLRLPASLVASRRRDVVLLLRLGAGVNAMDALNRLLLMEPSPDDVGQHHVLTRLQAFYLAVGLLAEVGKTFKKEWEWLRFWELVDVAAKNGMPWDDPVSLETARRLLNQPRQERKRVKTAWPTRPAESTELDTLLRVRNKVAFHWDRSPFATFLNTGEPIDIIEFQGPRVRDRIFLASSLAVAGHVFDGQETKKLITQVIDAQWVIGQVVSLAIGGLLIEAGIDPASCVELIDPTDERGRTLGT